MEGHFHSCWDDNIYTYVDYSINNRKEIKNDHAPILNIPQNT